MPLSLQNNTESLSDCSEGTPPKTVSVHKIKNIINILIKIAKNSAVNQRHSAALIKGDEIYNIGFNKYCSNAKYSTVHAEIDALLTFNKKYIKGIKGMDIIIIRIGAYSKSDKINLKISRPCNNCIDTLRKFDIRKVYYSDEYGNIVYENLKDMQKKHTSAGEKYKLTHKN
jgi:deoxycytidylate deaminase